MRSPSNSSSSSFARPPRSSGPGGGAGSKEDSPFPSAGRRLYTAELDDLDGQLDDLASKPVSFQKFKIAGKYENYRLCSSGKVDDAVEDNVFLHQDNLRDIQKRAGKGELPNFVHGTVVSATVLRDVKRFGKDVRSCGIVEISLQLKHDRG
eukprot:tig00021518_g22034.t1